MFKVYKRDLADVEPTEYRPAAEGAALCAGMAAVLSGGCLKQAGTAEKPTHILLGIARGDGLYPVMRVQPTTVFETVCAAAVPDGAVGSAVKLHIDSLSVTADTTGGVFAVEQTENRAGGFVRGRFL